MAAATHLGITGAKGGESKPKTPVEAPDSLRSTNVAKILLAVGEGEFDGTPTDRDIYLDNTPIVDASGNTNFPGVKWEWRRGTLEQEYIQGIPAVENETTVGVELRSDNPFTRALSDIKLSAVRVRMAWPRLLSQDANGNTNGYRVEYAIDIATDGGAYVEAHRGAVDGKTSTGYQRSVRINLPKAASGWMMRVRRITPNANVGTIADTMNVAGYTEIIDEKLRYPNTALLYVEFDAQQFQNIPAVTVRCKAKRWPVPSNYDPVARTYTGVWDGSFKQAWTNNPAFVTYGLCVEDRFGLGKRIKSWMVDKWEMYRIAQYCDQLVPNGVGGQEPRFLCDLNLQGRSEAWVLLRDLSAIYRGMVYWAHGSLFMQADMPRAQDIDYVFTRANVIDGEFVYGGAERNTHYSRALVSYDNPANNYDTDVIPVTDVTLQRRYRDRPVEISAIGCTRASEAQRRGKWALLSNNQDRTVTFKTGMEGRIPLPGYVIPVADELVAGRANGGRISASSGRTVTLDRDTPIKAGDRLIVNLPNGTAQARTVQAVKNRVVTVTTAYSAQPQPQLQWAIDYSDLAVQLFRVLKTTRTQEGQYEISALEFNPSKFASIDTGAKLDERPISVIPVTTVQPPASVTLSSAHMIDQGIAVNTMTIAWAPVPGAVGYDVEWRKDNGNWIRLQRTGTNSVDVTGIYAGAYLARVRAVSAFDIASIWKSSVLTQLKGKAGVPPAVTSLATESLLFGIGLKWTFPAGAEDTQRTELWYSEGTDQAKATRLADLAYPQDKHTLQGLRAGQRFYFWARLVDKSGNVGPWFPTGTTLVTGMASADAGPILEQIKEQITASELGKELLKEIDKISGSATLPGSVAARVGEVRTEVDKVRTDVGKVNQTVQELDAELDRSVANLDASVQQVGQNLEQVRGNLQTQITDIGTIARSVPYSKDKTYTTGQTVQGADGKLYQAVKAVPVHTSPPNTTYWLDMGQAVVTANGLAARVQKVESDVSTVDGKVTAQASQVSGLQTSLTTTDKNVTAAQAAADAANALAGGKGKVLVQSATPVAADRLAQNLWIDTTNSANTPKRWTGSAWAAVSDKAATDAAAAAASALALAQTKADASVVDSLSSTVTEQGNKLTSQGQAVTGLQNSLVTTNSNVTAAQQAAQAASDFAGSKGKVLVQSSAPAAAERLAQNLWIDTTGGANTPKRWTGSTWAAVSDKVATDAAVAAASALSQVASKAESSVVQALTGRVEQTESGLTSQGQAMTGLQNSLSTTNGNVTAAQQAAQAAADLAGTKGKVLVQSAAPATADRLAQNLWIDTTAGANTPKRWSGSAWVAVSDKVATDAASAAASALSQVATKAEASSVQALTNTVNQQGTTLTAQGQALTNIQATVGGIGGAGSNLVPDTYSWLSTATLPTLATSNMGDMRSAADPAAPSGYRLRMVRSAAANPWLMLCPSNDAAGWNIQLATGKYLLSFWANGNAGAVSNGLKVRCALRDGTSFGLTDFTLTTTRTRYTAVITVSAETVGAVLFYVPAGAEGDVFWIDSVMLERQLGDNTAPSAFIAGPSAQALASVATATQALDARVTRNEGTTTSQGEALTRLNSTVGGKADASSVSLLANRVTQTEQGLTSQGQSLVSLNTSIGNTSQDNLLRNPDFNASGDLPTVTSSEYTLAYLDRGAAGVPAGAPADRLLCYTKLAEYTGWGGRGLFFRNGTLQLPVQAGEVLNLECQMYCENPTAQSGKIALTFWEGDSGNTSIGGNIRLLGYDVALGGWQKLVVQRTVPANAGRVSLYLAVNDGAPPVGFKMWLANLKLTRQSAGEALQASATQALTNRVQQNEAGLSSQSQSLTQLTNSLQTTNGNVTAAAQAAQAASDLAGSKGKVIVQNAAPTTADRLAQNLWIDTTGGANTPKRWSGSTWAAVTDKVATDAAAAAASALSQLASKAEASAVQSLTSRVEQTESGLSSQGQSLTGLQNSLTTTNGNVTTAQQAAQAASDLAGSKGKVIVQSAAPAATDRLAQNLWIDTTGNANTPKRWTGSAWAAVTDKVATDAAAAAASALTQVATKADSAAVQSLTNTVTQQGKDLTAQGGALTNVQASLATLGASGINLLPAEYSAFGTTLPALDGTGFVASLEREAAAFRQSSLRLDWPSASSSLAVYLAASRSGDVGYNMGMKPQKYIISYRARASVEGHVVALFLRSLAADGSVVNSASAVQQPLTTGWVRYSYVADLSGAAFTGDRMMLVLQPNRSGVASRSVWLDQVMVEPVVNGATAPSAFTLGSSFDQASANAEATSAINARVTQTEKDITSQSGQLTQLGNSLSGKADNSALQSLASTVSKQGDTLSAQGTAVTQLKSSIGGIGGAGSNLLPDVYSWLSSTTLPALASSSMGEMRAAADTAAPSGYRLRAVRSAAANPWFMFSPTNNTTGWNIALSPGNYLLSFWANANTAAVSGGLTIRSALWDGSARGATDITLTTTRTRYTSVINITAETVVAIVFFQPAGAEGGVFWIDSVMLERQLGEGTAPSAFVAGPSAQAVSGQATAISQLQTETQQIGTAVTAQASRLDGLYVQVNPEMEGDSTGLAGATGAFVGVWTERSARVEGDVAIGKDMETVQARIGETDASVQQLSQAQATLTGIASASYSVKLNLTSNGTAYAAGFGIGIDNSGGTFQSTFAVMADRFAVMNPVGEGLIAPFAVQNGQVVMNEALISKAMISNAILGSTISSAAQTSWGGPVMTIDFNIGETVTRHSTQANTYTVMNREGIQVVVNGVLRVRMGTW